MGYHGDCPVQLSNAVHLYSKANMPYRYQSRMPRVYRRRYYPNLTKPHST
jgi:hypothetical protein